MPTEPHRIPRSLLVAPFLIAMVWFYVAQTIASQSARGLTFAAGVGEYQPLVDAVFLLFLILTGFATIAWAGSRRVRFDQLLALRRRAGWQREWALGAAVGWGIVILAVLPMALTGTLWPECWVSGRALWLTVISLLTVAIGSLVEEVVFRGYPFRLLMDCIGPTPAVLLLSVLFAVAHPLGGESALRSFCGAFLFGVLLSIAYLRTHALWLPWGLHFAWSASMGVLFGLPVQGRTDLSTMVAMRAIGPSLLTGGSYGPAAAVLTLFVLIAAIAVLVRVTRDYAWRYTHPPIVAAGYPMEPKVPAPHAAMEQEAQQSAGGLVQILPLSPRSDSESSQDAG